MTAEHDPQPSNLRELLHQARFGFRTHADPSSVDPDLVTEIVRQLTQAAYRFNLLAVTEFGGRSGRERSPGLVEQIIASAFQTFEGYDPHPDPQEKAAVLFRGIVQGHPFSDGNRRTGFLLTLYFLSESGLPVPAEFPTDETIEFCLRVSAGEIRDVDVIRGQLVRWFLPRQDDQ